MRYTEAPEKATELIDAIDAELAAERAAKTDGRPHVSDTLYCLRKSWRIRQIKASGLTVEREDENQRLILLIGQALHTIVAKALGRDSNVRLESDWLVGEADARLLTDGTVEEFKTARAGFSVDDPAKWPHYIEQVASYMVLAKAMGTATLQGVLHVLHLTFSSGPRWYQPHPRKLKRETDEEYAVRLDDATRLARLEYEQKVADWVIEEGRHSNLRSWPLEFDQWEIDAWEQELKRRVAILQGPVEPSVDENVPADRTGYSWTCQYCPFFFKKGGDCPGGVGRPASFFPVDRIRTDGDTDVPSYTADVDVDADEVEEG